MGCTYWRYNNIISENGHNALSYAHLAPQLSDEIKMAISTEKTITIDSVEDDALNIYSTYGSYYIWW